MVSVRKLVEYKLTTLRCGNAENVKKVVRRVKEILSTENEHLEYPINLESWEHCRSFLEIYQPTKCLAMFTDDDGNLTLKRYSIKTFKSVVASIDFIDDEVICNVRDKSKIITNISQIENFFKQYMVWDIILHGD